MHHQLALSMLAIGTVSIASVVSVIMSPKTQCHMGSTCASVSPVSDEIAALGKVHWLRNYDQAVEQSKQTSKPIFALFQEIPGCSTCVGFGQTVLNHPLVVEAIENAFVPLAVYNNDNQSDSADARTMRKFNEPPLNYPVVRFLNGSNSHDLIPRKDGVWTAGPMVSRMIEALKADHRDIPTYLTLLNNELNAHDRQSVTFSMFCFWEGQGKLGALPGVLSTKAVYVDGHEGVTVEYDPSRITLESLTKNAMSMQCAWHAYASESDQIDQLTRMLSRDKVSQLAGNTCTDAPVSDQRHDLNGTALKLLPMTTLQATRINALEFQGKHKEALACLSPNQQTLLHRMSVTLNSDATAFTSIQPAKSVEQWWNTLDAINARLK